MSQVGVSGFSPLHRPSTALPHAVKTHWTRMEATVIEEKDSTIAKDGDGGEPEKNLTMSDDFDKIFPEEFMKEVEMEAEMAALELVDEECEVDPLTGDARDELCLDEEAKAGMRSSLKAVVERTLELVGYSDKDELDISRLEKESQQQSTEAVTWKKPLKKIGQKIKSYVGMGPQSEEDLSGLSEGEILERGWEQRGQSSALVRNAEVWKFALASVFKTLKPRKMRKTGNATEAEIEAAQIEAAEYIRDGLLTLGPSFVKLGQVASTRTDVLPSTFTNVLKTLTDEGMSCLWSWKNVTLISLYMIYTHTLSLPLWRIVPGFNGAKAKEIVSRELGRPCDEIFTDFSPEPLKAASLGQVHTAYYKGKKVAIKVQRAGLKELFDVDLKVRCVIHSTIIW